MSNELKSRTENRNVSIYGEDVEENKGLSEGLQSNIPPVIKIKNDKLALVVGSEVLESFEEINAVILAYGDISRRYYNSGFTGRDFRAPNCASSNGKIPDPDIKNPMSNLCSKCPKNVLGNKLCKDFRRLVLFIPDSLTNDVYKLYRFDVPSASLFPLSIYGEKLDLHRVPISAVITNISLDKTATFPKLSFKRDGDLDPEYYKSVVLKAKKDPMVHSILNPSFGDRQDNKPQEDKPRVAKVSKFNASAFKQDLEELTKDLE